MSVMEGRVVSAERHAAAEAYRILRSSVKFAAGERPVRSVLIVDVDRRTPSGVARHLAEAFASAGDSCVLVDTDVRAANPDTPGFSDLLYGAAPMNAVVRPLSGDLLAEVEAGTARNADVLAGDRLGDAIGALLETYEYVILSAASLPEHADALAIAPRVDAVVLVVTSGKTRRPRAIDARDALDRVGARLLGVVMVETKRRLFW